MAKPTPDFNEKKPLDRDPHRAASQAGGEAPINDKFFGETMRRDCGIAQRERDEQLRDR